VRPTKILVFILELHLCSRHSRFLIYQLGSHPVDFSTRVTAHGLGSLVRAPVARSTFWLRSCHGESLFPAYRLDFVLPRSLLSLLFNPAARQALMSGVSSTDSFSCHVSLVLASFFVRGLPREARPTAVVFSGHHQQSRLRLPVQIRRRVRFSSVAAFDFAVGLGAYFSLVFPVLRGALLPSAAGGISF
jgi:hypothetical protein